MESIERRLVEKRFEPNVKKQAEKTGRNGRRI